MIREAREAKGMTMAALAEAIGAATPHVSMWETGVRVPHEGWSAKIATALGIDPDLLEIHCGRAPEALRKDPLGWAERILKARDAR